MPEQGDQCLRTRINTLMLMTKSRNCAVTQDPAGRQFTQD
jgi:hypothetical protein